MWTPAAHFSQRAEHKDTCRGKWPTRGVYHEDEWPNWPLDFIPSLEEEEALTVDRRNSRTLKGLCEFPVPQGTSEMVLNAMQACSQQILHKFQVGQSAWHTLWQFEMCPPCARGGKCSKQCPGYESVTCASEKCHCISGNYRGRKITWHPLFARLSL